MINDLETAVQLRKFELRILCGSCQEPWVAEGAQNVQAPVFAHNQRLAKELFRHSISSSTEKTYLQNLVEQATEFFTDGKNYRSLNTQMFSRPKLPSEKDSTKNPYIRLIITIALGNFSNSMLIRRYTNNSSLCKGLSNQKSPTPSYGFSPTTHIRFPQNAAVSSFER